MAPPGSSELLSVKLELSTDREPPLHIQMAPPAPSVLLPSKLLPLMERLEPE